MLNKVMLIGRLGKDPEMRYTASGDPVASFSVAVEEKWKNKDGEKMERVTWVDVVAWKKLATISGEYLQKGSKVYIEGKLQKREWEAEGGGKRSKMEVIAGSILFLDTNKNGSREEREENPFGGDETPF